ncbi:MAG: ABC-F family ATP-binding cassette domain-containing protein [Clostridia bacterium]|nr:ABC-F family ATP-binding cassette domain-containing protein [Clostridia bacterium]MBQ9925975.1 ABC-F family ATP-binding cassette domain-containing protein [Clostridia bacterium]
MAEISVTQLNKYFGEHHVLQDISFELFKGERVSLIGQNGSGKTTLFKILTGRMDYDSGSLYINKNGRVGLLEQLPEYPEEVTVREVLLSAFEHIFDAERRMRELEEKMDSDPTAMDAYAKLTVAYETMGGYEYMTQYNIMTNGLDIPPEMQDRPFMSLSGGEKTRVNLARIMLSGTDILLLDEPTNHLDLDTIRWLENYLKTYKGTALIISHDRYFLDEATNRTLELEDGKITSWPGNYSYYVDRKAELREQLEAAKKRQDKEIAQLAFTVERMKGWGLGNKKVMKRAFAMEKRLDRIERIETMRKTRKMTNRFSMADASGDEVYNIVDLACGYDKKLVEDINALVLRGERIALLGPNGCGKTTMLRTILGQLAPMDGVVMEGVGVKTGYLPQVVSFDHPERNLVDTLLYETNCSTQAARDRLAAFGFRGEEVFKTVNVLSGGEKTRLKLCLFMSDSVNTLFLDEPTNHLDLASREWLEESIDDFSETMIFVSHDRYFINRFATRIWQVEDGKILDYTGNYDEFLKKREVERLRELAQQNNAPKKEAEPKKEKEKPQQKGGNLKQLEKQRKERQKEIGRIEKRIEEIDRETEEKQEDYMLLAQLVEEKEQLEERLLELYEAEEEANI